MSGGSAGARRVSAAYLLLTLALLGVAGWCLLSRALAPSDGTTVNAGDSAVVVSSGAVLVTGAEPGSALRVGDQLLAIDHVLLTGQVPGGGAVRPGDSLTYQVVRGGEVIEVEVDTGPFPLFQSLLDGWPTVLVVALLSVISLTIYLVRPGEAAARAALVAAGLAAVTTAGATFFPLQALDLVAGDQFWRWFIGEASFVLLWSAMLHFALAFPAVTTKRFRLWVTLGYAGGPLLYGVACAVAAATTDSGLARLVILASPALPALFVFPLLIFAVLARQYVRSADQTSRRRLRWLAAALGFGAVCYLAVWALPTLVTGTPLLPERFHTLAFLPVPIAVALAVLRHRALDIEVVLSRSLVYGALSAGVIGIYVAVVAGLSLLFPPLTQAWQQGLAAATVAVLIQPLRTGLQGLVNKRLFGYTDDPYRVVSRLASRLADTHTPGAALPRIVESLAMALRLPYVAIEIRDNGRTEVAAVTGTPSADRHELALTHQGERVGTLVVGGRSVLRSRDRLALADVARHAGTAVYTARLTQDLRRSRDRLVQAREEERRRILHELHDGVGPTLAAIALGLDASRRGVDPASASGVLLGRMRDELQDAITEIRRLAAGLRPPVLDQIGLVPALREYAGTLASRTAKLDGTDEGVTIMLEVPTVMPRLPSSIDVAAYRIVCEALTNVTRHAYARSCAVRLWIDDDLHIEVVDDGIGLPGHTFGGVGLASMRERAAELGGDCLVAAEAEGGTRVLATLPLPKEVATA
ncbi:Histidine kinase-, DNA gyrase B-, and HSP90-like ATPase [Actinokineospora alba]|uniref:Histidine kinase-, DNA gyrase B-, and HSP90-like ATPase n=1 Tax=Actinokineospora alba TaxID=504798 RepID=A0A1H0N1M7_9PSEU|nr:histidine kinase [Actinokineospora alba]TDP68524.1 histidine kinase/DNA gyrase B/HSP90-like ATPase [Actinokineospora alba]SDH80918.1 Histidine kinase-, DNA gyrase B-, and HSP90-like ATPase [Actinokineospora alba]SDO86567.1 Histidine kinase-, DNA gyrase B-, and HSP90-like ATPase [Actinokineospora alba]